MKRFRSLLSPRRYLQGQNKVLQPDGAIGRRQWVVSRGLCLYRTFMLGDIPPAERTNALDHRIRQWSPFKETGRYIIHDRTNARVWIWDESWRGRAALEAGMDTPRIYPEPVLRARPEGDALRLVSCFEGFESQIWKNGMLVASHWWPEPPHQEAWKRFAASHDLNPPEAVPEPVKPPWLGRPWGGPADSHKGFNFRREKFWVSLAIAAAAFFTIWYGVAITRWHEADRTIIDRIEILSREVEPVIEARAQAMKYRSRASNLDALTDCPTQLELMAEVAQRLPQNVIIAEWRYNSDNLKFVLEGSNFDPRDYVTNFQKIPFFRDVNTSRGSGPNRLVIGMKIGRAP